MRDMHESEVKNLIHVEMHEYKESIRALGIPTEKGCFYGKALHDYVHGKIRSDLNDTEAFKKEQKEVNKRMEKQFEAAASLTLEAGESVKEAKKTLEESKAENSKLMKSLLRAIVVGLIVAFAVQAISSGAKLWQDSVNQKETAGHLEDFSVLLSSMVQEQKELKKEIEVLKGANK